MQRSQSEGGLAGASRQLLMRGFRASLAMVLATSVCGVFPVSAYASEVEILDGWSAAAQSAASPGYQSYTASDSADAIALADNSNASDEALPSWYSLLDPNSTHGGILDENGKMYAATDDSVVTPVKFQNPWGTCWGFSIIAACETSILAEAGKTYKETGLDLSELQLANAVYRNGGAPESVVGSAQAGEGYHNSSDNINLGFDTGGMMFFGVNIFAAGIGPAPEKYATYRNTGIYNNGEAHDDDPVYEVIVTKTTSEDKNETSIEYLTQSQIDALKDDASVVECRKRSYAGNWNIANEDGDRVTVCADWSIASQKGVSQADDDLSWWDTALFNLEDGNELPSTRVLDDEGTFVGINWEGVNAIKNELYADPNDETDTSRAVSVAFKADNSMPGDSSRNARYISDEWAHYTYETVQSNHMVTIVGWDDNYDKFNFAKGFENSEEGVAAHTPEGNGAWLVKNSWGSETGDSFDSVNFPSDWGILNAAGEHTGYFWVSYYDASLCDIETYDFDLNSYSDNTEYLIDQYDYLPADKEIVNDSETPLYSANIFTAESDMDLRTLSCSTYKQNTTVVYEVYLLDSKDAKPGDSEHGELARTFYATYEYGGYHRYTIDEVNWLPMREGQNYAVVITQQTADGMYHQGVAINEEGKLSEDALNAYAEECRTNLENYYRAIYKKSFEDYYNSDEGKKEIEAQGITFDEAVQKALEEAMASEDVVDTINARVSAAKKDRESVYFEAKVNKGESLSGASEKTGEYGGVSEDATWVDWTDVVEAVTAKNATYAVDNAPIKAFAEIADYASIDELNALKQAIAAAEAALNAAKISSDGSDVAVADTWMTQEQYDSLAAAIDAAKEGLAAAGDDYENVLVRSTPSSSSVSSLIAAIAFDEQHGTKAASAAANDKAAKGNGAYAKTGDAATSAAAALACVATIACAAAITARRRQRDE